MARSQLKTDTADGTKAPSRSESGYDAFISYSHAADGKLAPALQRGLQRLARPWHHLSVLRVFRDTTSLSATPSLWSEIERALERSRFFVLLASPAAAQSQWVRREVDWWLEHRQPDHLLIALTEGAILWDPLLHDFDWTHTTALPTSLAGIFHEEPGWVDLSWARTSEAVNLRHPEFRSAVADLAAPLHGVGKESLVSEDVRQQRRASRARKLAVFLLAATTVVAVVAALIAVAARNSATLQRDVATSRQLASQSVTERSDRLDRSLLLSLAALEFRDTTEARAALAGAVEALPELAAMFHGENGSSSVAFSTDGVLASGDGKAVAIWDQKTGRRAVPKLTGHRAEVIEMAYGSDGESLASVSADGEVRRWDPERSESEAQQLAGVDSVTSAAFNTELTMVAVVTAEGIGQVWDLEAGRHLTDLAATDLDDPVLSVAFSPEDDLLAFGTELGRIHFWDAVASQTMSAFIDGATGGDYSTRVSSLQFDPSGSMVAAGGGGGGGTTLWDLETLESVHFLGTVAGDQGPVESIAFSPDGSLIATGHADRALRLWSTHDWEQLSVLPGHGVVTDLAFSDDSAFLASSSNEGPVLLWQARHGSEVGRLARGLGDGGASDLVSSVEFSPSGQLLASTALEEVEFWDHETGRRVGQPLSLDGGFFDALAHHPGGELLATSLTRYVGSDYQALGDLVLWDLASRRPRGEPLTEGGPLIGAVAFSPDGDVLVSGDADGRLVLWDVDSGRRRGEPLTEEGPVIGAVAFSPDGDVLVSGDAEGRLVSWDVDSGRRRGEPLTEGGPGITAVAFSPDGDVLASGDADGRIFLWDPRTGRPRGPGLMAELGESLSDLAFSPNGRMLASAGGQVSGVSLWDVDSGQKIVRLEVGTADQILSVDFSPDGRSLAWGALSIAPSPYLVVAWDADLKAWKEAACGSANRNLSREEWDRYVGPDVAYKLLCGGQDLTP